MCVVSWMEGGGCNAVWVGACVCETFECFWMFYLCSLKKKMHAGDNCVFCVLLCSLSVCVCVRHVCETHTRLTYKWWAAFFLFPTNGILSRAVTMETTLPRKRSPSLWIRSVSLPLSTFSHFVTLSLALSLSLYEPPSPAPSSLRFSSPPVSP